MPPLPSAIMGTTLGSHYKTTQGLKWGQVFLSPDMAPGQGWGKDLTTLEGTQCQVAQSMEKAGGLKASTITWWK